MSQNHTENFVKDDPSKNIFNNNNKNNNPHKAKRRSTSTRISREQDPEETQKNSATKQYSNKDMRTRCIIWRSKCVNYKQQKAMKVIKDDGK